MTAIIAQILGLKMASAVTPMGSWEVARAIVAIWVRSPRDSIQIEFNGKPVQHCHEASESSTVQNLMCRSIPVIVIRVIESVFCPKEQTQNGKNRRYDQQR